MNDDIQKKNMETASKLCDMAYLRHAFTAAEFMDGNNPRTDAERESHCKTFCKYRRKHKCAKHGGRIIHAPCDPIAEYMRQKEAKK